MIGTTVMKKSQGTQSATLATEEMVALWQAAAGATFHGPKCTCAGFGLLRRNKSELERDVVEFLIAKYEEKQKVTIVHLFERWLDERTSGWNSIGTKQTGLARVGPATARRDESLLQWIDCNAPLLAVSKEDLREMAAEIRTLLESMAMPAGGFFCG
jgi:hypothetical protein